MKTYLGKKGYTIRLKDFTDEKISTIKEDLTFTPFQPKGYGPDPIPFSVYKISNNKMFIPKFYGISMFGIPKNKIPDGDSISLTFNGTLRENQIEPVNECLKASETTGGGILCLPCGWGKCLGLNTPVLMYDGSIKMVQDIKIGDVLMGDDSTPRNILSICQGKEQLYKIIQEKGDPYIVNESHILSLKSSNTVINISVKDYLQSEPLLGYKVPVDFPEKKVYMDPYIIGTTNHFPKEYIYNSRSCRLQLFAGLIDSIGLKKDNGYIIYSTVKDIIFIAKSLGFAIDIYDNYFFIYGKGIGDIPVKEKCESNEDVLLTKINVEKLDIGDYYGFEIDGNRLFLLGDFTVTHNTSISLYLIVKLSVKALIIVNKEFLLEQWKERIQQFIPDAKIGILRQKKIDIENKDIVIGMLQSIAMCDYDSSIYKSFGITFYDEVHCVPSKIFSKALRKINTKYHFGLSATPNRQDGMTKVTNLYIGPIIYKVNTNKQNPKNVQVFTISFDKLPSVNYKSLMNYQGKPDVVKMISNIIKCPKRLELISFVLQYFIKDKRHILVLSDRIQYLQDIERKIRENDISFKIGYYVGGMKEKERKESEQADLILASYSMAKEAMDIPILDTLLMVTSKSNIEQSIGRIQRKTIYPEERPPLIIDLVDSFSSFQSQANKREVFYKKNNYPIYKFIITDINNLSKEFKNITFKPAEVCEKSDDCENKSDVCDFENYDFE